MTKRSLPYIVLVTWTLGVLVYYMAFTKPVDNGGDMVEYFGMTESLINHQSLDLTNTDYQNLKKYLAPGYFKVENGFEETKGGFMAYMMGLDGKKYSIHFWFYSFLAVPFRLLLRFFHQSELFVFTLTNLFIITGTLWYVMKKYLDGETLKQVLLIVLIYTSPLVFFVSYPGVDIFYTMILLVAVFAFFAKKIELAIILTALASWHSQPLSVFTVFVSVFYLINKLKYDKGNNQIVIPLKTLVQIVMLGFVSGFILALPYITNILLFGVASPWYILPDGWTTIYGFGIHNASLWRLYEQFFDLNMGLFWYAPALLITGVYLFARLARKNSSYWIVFLAIIVTAFSYQTNPAWKYGSAGFSPTRHVIFVIPFLIFLIAKFGKISKKWMFILLIPILLQVFALAQNNYLSPDFFNSLHQSAYARFVLNRWPSIYNPTPKIFVDNTTHTDKKFLTTAIYKDDKGQCKKAYVTTTDKWILEKECGKSNVTTSIPDDELRFKKASFYRTTFATEVIYWADPLSCGSGYAGDFVCMKTIDDFVLMTGIDDKNRIEKLTFDGAWKVKLGDVIKIPVPPGYIVEYRSLLGSYVNFD